jgi:chromosome partitioning protein
MKPYVITVCHQKGGVAKTTTVSALGGALAEDHRRVLLVDLDPSANLTAGLGLSPFKQRKSAGDVLLGNETLAMVSRETEISGLDLIPSNGDMKMTAQMLAVRANHETILREAVRRQEIRQYDYVIFDCPPSLGALVDAALIAADLAILPTQPEYFAVQALGTIFKRIDKLRAEHNPGLCYRLLITMYDQRGNLHTDLLERIRGHYGDALLEIVIGFDSKLRASQIAGVPITTFASNTRAATQYRSLAKEIYTYVEEKTIPQPA